MKKVWIFLFFQTSFTFLYPQVSSVSLGFKELHVHRGFIIPHHSDMYHMYRPVHAIQYQRIKPESHQNTRLGYQIYLADLGSRHLGWSASTSAIFDYQILEYQRTALNLGIGMGIGYVSRPYDVQINPYNRAIGSHLNAFGQLYLGTRTILPGGWGLNFQLRFSHFSNGGAKAPNLGVNIPSISLGLSKGFDSPLKSKESGFKRSWNGFTSIRLGIKNSDIDDNRTFFVPVFEGGLIRALTPQKQIRMGLSMNFDPLYRFEKFTPLAAPTLTNVFEIGFHFGYKYKIQKWSMLLDAGIYIYKPKPGLKTPYFEALGLGYELNEHWEVLGRLRANKSTADIIEWGLVYHW